MSGYLQGRVWFYDVRGSERDVLLALADWAHDDGTSIYPSMELLAWKVGVSKRQVQRVVGELRKRGVLVVVREATRHDPTHYRMDLSKLPAKAPFEAAKSGVTNPSPLESRGDISSHLGVTNGASRGDIQMSPKPLEEPLEEPLEGGEQTSLDVDPALVQRFIDWHKTKVTARVGRPPARSVKSRESAQKLVAWVQGDSTELKAMWEFACGSSYWADKVLTLTDWARHYVKLRAATLAALEQARSRPQRRDETFDVPKARRVTYD